MPKKIIGILLAVSLAAATLFTAATWPLPLYIVGYVGNVVLSGLPWKFEYCSEISRGNKIVSKIEDFRKQHHRLPNPDNTEEMTALGFELIIGYKPDYRPLGPDAYEIEYYIGFDGPRIIYSSKTKQWYRAW